MELGSGFRALDLPFLDVFGFGVISWPMVQLGVPKPALQRSGFAAQRVQSVRFSSA